MKIEVNKREMHLIKKAMNERSKQLKKKFAQANGYGDEALKESVQISCQLENDEISAFLLSLESAEDEDNYPIVGF